MRDDELNTDAASTASEMDATQKAAFTSSFEVADPQATARIDAAAKSALSAAASATLPVSLMRGAASAASAASTTSSCSSSDSVPAAQAPGADAPAPAATQAPGADAPVPAAATREIPLAYSTVPASRTAQMPVQGAPEEGEGPKKRSLAEVFKSALPKRAAAPALQTSLPARAAARASEPRPLSRKAKTVIVVASCVVALLLVVYFAGVLYFSGHTFPNTKLNGRDASWASIDDLAAGRTTFVTDYKAELAGDGVNVAFSGTDIALGFDGEAFEAAVAEAVDEWAWPVELFLHRDYQVDESLSFDEAKLSEIVGSAIDAVNETADAPQDATISYDEKANKFTVKKEIGGTKVDCDAALATVSAAVKALKGMVELGAEQLVQPAVFSDDTRLADAAARASEYVSRSIDLVVGDTQVQTVDASLINGWVSLSDELAAVIDTGAVTTWTQGDLSRRCDTIGASRSYTRADGKQCSVSGGTYGWSIDGASLAQELADAIMSGSDASIDMPMNSTAARWAPGGADWTSYIDVDLGEQHARYYDGSGSIIWESDIVSGAAKNNRETPTGVYTINSNMGRDRTLIGSDENKDGKPDYETPVSYWMPFVGDSIAFHDANWRSSFGGTIYIENGSHGCVNLPSDKAAELYNLVQVGTVVVSHS